jgi:hypothetical protein
MAVGIADGVRTAAGIIGAGEAAGARDTASLRCTIAGGARGAGGAGSNGRVRAARNAAHRSPSRQPGDDARRIRRPRRRGVATDDRKRDARCLSGETNRVVGYLTSCLWNGRLQGVLG